MDDRCLDDHSMGHREFHQVGHSGATSTATAGFVKPEELFTGTSIATEIAFRHALFAHVRSSLSGIAGRHFAASRRAGTLRWPPIPYRPDLYGVHRELRLMHLNHLGQDKSTARPRTLRLT